MSMLQRLEITDQLMSRGDAIDARVHGETQQRNARQRPLLQALTAMWHLWRERRAARQALASVDARTLRDIGISPECVAFELSRWSWRPLLDWHAARYTHGMDIPRVDGMGSNSRRHPRG